MTLSYDNATTWLIRNRRNTVNERPSQTQPFRIPRSSHQTASRRARKAELSNQSLEARLASQCVEPCSGHDLGNISRSIREETLDLLERGLIVTETRKNFR